MGWTSRIWTRRGRTYQVVNRRGEDHPKLNPDDARPWGREAEGLLTYAIQTTVGLNDDQTTDREQGGQKMDGQRIGVADRRTGTRKERGIWT